MEETRRSQVDPSRLVVVDPIVVYVGLVGPPSGAAATLLLAMGVGDAVRGCTTDTAIEDVKRLLDNLERRLDRPREGERARRLLDELVAHERLLVLPDPRPAGPSNSQRRSRTLHTSVAAAGRLAGAHCFVTWSSEWRARGACAGLPVFAPRAIVRHLDTGLPLGPTPTIALPHETPQDALPGYDATDRARRADPGQAPAGTQQDPPAAPSRQRR